MANIDATQHVAFTIHFPKSTNLPIETIAGSSQDPLTAFNKIARLSKNLSYRILQRQPAFSPLTIRDVPGKATSVDELSTFPVNTGANAAVLNRTIFAPQARFIILKHLTGSQ